MKLTKSITKNNDKIKVGVIYLKIIKNKFKNNLKKNIKFLAIRFMKKLTNGFLKRILKLIKQKIGVNALALKRRQVMTITKVIIITV